MAYRLISCFGALICFRGFAVGTQENDEWLSFPTRHGAVRVHRECVHHFDDTFHVEGNKDGGDVLWSGHEHQSLPRCPHATRWLNSSAVQASNPEYYSDWVAYAVTSSDFSYMSSDWVVPAAPKSTGPVPGMSSSYFFNGLEDGGAIHGNATYILQPVLTYGKSGCIVNPVNFFQWHFVSFLVTAGGRAYCGKRLSVHEGERIRGIMKLEEDGKTWTTSSVRLSNNDTSTQSTKLGDNQPNAAYVVLETMINYNCRAFPAGGSVTFTGNVLKTRAGANIIPSWRTVLRHTECHQQVRIAPDGAVTIFLENRCRQVVPNLTAWATAMCDDSIHCQLDA